VSDEYRRDGLQQFRLAADKRIVIDFAGFLLFIVTATPLLVA
jgi:hypothetical protein